MKIWKKWKKTAGYIIILNMCTINDIIWCMIPEIFNATDQIFCYFGPFFALLPTHPLKTQKIKILNKWKKHLETYTIILHKCTNNYDHMLCSSWDMACVRCNYFSFWVIFCPFTPLTAQKIKILKKNMKKTPGDIIILHMCTKNNDQMMYSSWYMVCNGWIDGWKKWHRQVGANLKNWTFLEHKLNDSKVLLSMIKVQQHNSSCWLPLLVQRAVGKYLLSKT